MGYLDGFGVILKKWFAVQTDSGARVTLEYPEEVRPKPERFHGRHVLNRYEDGMEKCIGCELCAAVCPAKCIYVRGKDNDPEDPTSPGERFGYVYEINYLRCIHCDLCVEACPTEAITETKLFEFSFTNREDAIYTKNELLVGDDGRPKQLPWENWDGGFDPARDTSGWMRATAPQGDNDFKNIVAWAGELGYGVRPPERGDVLDEVGPVPSVAPAHDPHDDHIAHTPDEGRGVDALAGLDDAGLDDAALFEDAAIFGGTGTTDGLADIDDASGMVAGGDADVSTIGTHAAATELSDTDLSEAARFDSDGPASRSSAADATERGDDAAAAGAVPGAGDIDSGAAKFDATGDADAAAGSDDAGGTGTAEADATDADSADADVAEVDAEAATFDAPDDGSADPGPQVEEKHRAPGHFDADDVPEPDKKKKGRFRR